VRVFVYVDQIGENSNENVRHIAGSKRLPLDRADGVSQRTVNSASRALELPHPSADRPTAAMAVRPAAKLRCFHAVFLLLQLLTTAVLSSNLVRYRPIRIFCVLGKIALALGLLAQAILPTAIPVYP